MQNDIQKIPQLTKQTVLQYGYNKEQVIKRFIPCAQLLIILSFVHKYRQSWKCETDGLGRDSIMYMYSVKFNVFNYVKDVMV